MRNTIHKWNPNLNQISTLEEIDLVNLDMYGILDATFSGLTSLKVLNLAHNRMTGTLPDIFASLPNLEVIQLSDNKFEGSLPPSLPLLPKLKYLEGFNNAFTGSVPVVTSQEIYGIDFSSNKMSGTFPSAYFSETSFPKFLFLNINFNEIDIPQHCIRYAICYKETMIDTVDGDSIASLDAATKTIISNALDTYKQAEIAF